MRAGSRPRRRVRRTGRPSRSPPPAGLLTNLGAQPAVTVNNAVDGSGTNTVSPLTTLAGTATTETFTYTAPTGGMTNGAVTIVVPAGWTAPQLAAGCRPGQHHGRVDLGCEPDDHRLLPFAERGVRPRSSPTPVGSRPPPRARATGRLSRSRPPVGRRPTSAWQPSVTVNNAADGRRHRRDRSDDGAGRNDADRDG